MFHIYHSSQSKRAFSNAHAAVLGEYHPIQRRPHQGAHLHCVLAQASRETALGALFELYIGLRKPYSIQRANMKIRKFVLYFPFNKNLSVLLW